MKQWIFGVGLLKREAPGVVPDQYLLFCREENWFNVCVCGGGGGRQLPRSLQIAHQRKATFQKYLGSFTFWQILLTYPILIKRVVIYRYKWTRPNRMGQLANLHPAHWSRLNAIAWYRKEWIIRVRDRSTQHPLFLLLLARSTLT